jgi:hypothetical protein
MCIGQRCRRTSKVQGTTTRGSVLASRRIFHQCPGNPKLKYNCQYCLEDGHKEDVCFKKKNGTPGQFSRHTSPSAAAVDVARPAQDVSEISSEAKSIATSIQKLRNLLSGTDVNSTDYTACRVQVPPRPVRDSAASHTMCKRTNFGLEWEATSRR